MKSNDGVENRFDAYPKLWEEDGDCSNQQQSNHPSHNMPRHIKPGTEESFHWARSVPNTVLSPTSRVVTTNPCSSDESHLSTYFQITRKSLVVAQEFVLSALFLASHRCLWLEMNEEEIGIPVDYMNKAHRSAFASIFFFTLWIANVRRNQRKHHQSKVEQGKRGKNPKVIRILTRFQDLILIAGMLRLLSSVLRTLTASYSSDTVAALAITGMVLHILSNDYKYANGNSDDHVIPRGSINIINLEQIRPSFASGTVSMNFSFLVAALLTSRLKSDFASYLFFIKTVVLFAYYPVARHIVAFTYGDKAGVFPITFHFNISNLSAHSPRLLDNMKTDFLTLTTTLGLSYSVFYLLRDGLEVQIFFIVLLFILVVAPIWKSWLMRHKTFISGPWDIAHVVLED